MNSEKKLSHDRHDIDSKLGFLSKKFTGVNLFLTALTGGIFTGLFYLCLLPFNGKHDLISMFFHGGPKDRSSIPYYTIFFAFWAFAILLEKYLKLRVQRKALELAILPKDPAFILTPYTAREILKNIDEQVDEPSKFILLDRMHRALANFKNLGDVAGVAECLDTQAQNDDSYLSSSYTVLKGFIWAIPVLGFIGTVIGLSNAVGGFGATVAAGAGIEELKKSLGGVTSGLSVAFETTLIALVAALIIQLLMTLVLSKEEQFLDECSDYCHRNIIAKIKLAGLMDSEN